MQQQTSALMCVFMYVTFLHVSGTHTNPPSLITCNILWAAQANWQSWTSKKYKLFKHRFGAFSVGLQAVGVCLVFPLALLPLDITCVALRVAQPAMPFYEKWISSSLHCHGNAQLTHQFCPFKDLHQSCCSDGKVRNVGRGWFHPLVSVYRNASFIFYNDIQ